jgi:hypothetical protein
LAARNASAWRNWQLRLEKRIRVIHLPPLVIYLNIGEHRRQKEIEAAMAESTSPAKTLFTKRGFWKTQLYLLWKEGLRRTLVVPVKAAPLRHSLERVKQTRKRARLDTPRGLTTDLPRLRLETRMHQNQSSSTLATSVTADVA